MLQNTALEEMKEGNDVTYEILKNKSSNLLTFP